VPTVRRPVTVTRQTVVPLACGRSWVGRRASSVPYPGRRRNQSRSQYRVQSRTLGVVSPSARVRRKTVEKFKWMRLVTSGERRSRAECRFGDFNQKHTTRALISVRHGPISGIGAGYRGASHPASRGSPRFFLACKQQPEPCDRLNRISTCADYIDPTASLQSATGRVAPAGVANGDEGYPLIASGATHFISPLRHRLWRDREASSACAQALKREPTAAGERPAS